MSTDRPELRTHTEVITAMVELRGRRVVDVGCGSGVLVRWLRSQGADVVGVECGEVMMRSALEADPDHPEAYLDGVAQDLPLPDADADVVVFSYSLHHVPPEAMLHALGEAHRVLRPGGLLYVVEPVAAGPGHEIIRVVDDETEVRAHAQRALARSEEVGFVPVHTSTYTSRMVLPDAATLAERVVGVDPQRRERMAARRAEFVARFEALATPVDGGYALDQENRVAVFRRPS